MTDMTYNGRNHLKNAFCSYNKSNCGPTFIKNYLFCLPHMKKSCRFRANYFIFGWTITLNFGIFSHKADLNIEHKSRGPFHTLFWLRYPSNSHFACKKESHTGLDQLKGEKIRNTGWMISLNRSALLPEGDQATWSQGNECGYEHLPLKPHHLAVIFA